MKRPGGELTIPIYFLLLSTFGSLVFASATFIASGGRNESDLDRVNSTVEIRDNGLSEIRNPSQENEGSIPSSISIPRISVHANIDAGSSRMEKNPFLGSLELSFPVPATSGGVMWWADGPPVNGSGLSIFLGHSSMRGGAIFDNLEELHRGDTIHLGLLNDVIANFSVVETVSGIDKSDPNALRRVLESRSATRSMALITCSGSFDSEENANVQNVVVFADRAVG